jgi:hypothetical protein
MSNYFGLEIPIRSKLKMLEEIAQIVGYLHRGNRKKIDALVDDLKVRAIYLEDPIQHEVLQFAEAVYFQFDYDPWHKVTLEVGKAADRLIEALGFNLSFPYRQRR